MNLLLMNIENVFLRVMWMDANLFDLGHFQSVGEPPRVERDKLESFQPSASQLVLRLKAIKLVYAAVGMRAHQCTAMDLSFITLDAVVNNEAGKMTHFYAFYEIINNPSPDTNWPPQQSWDNN